MKKENGMTALNILLTLVISIIIVGVALAMILEKPEKSTEKQNVTNNEISEFYLDDIDNEMTNEDVIDEESEIDNQE